MREIILIAHDIRSCHNVGSLLRTAEGLGVAKVYLTGYTPYPLKQGDVRLPHIAQKLHKQISKTALGAETLIPWEHTEDVKGLIQKLKTNAYSLAALEQSASSTQIPFYVPPQKVALLLGREVDGIDKQLLQVCDDIIEIPMNGKKESFNVVQATAMTLYHIRFYKS